MKKGDIVKVYEDPFTCEKLEGVARLISHSPALDEPEFRCEGWVVQFKIGTRWEEAKVDRAINQIIH